MLETNGLNENLIHLVFTHSNDGVSRIYRNGVEADSRNIGGVMSYWVYQAKLSLGSALDGTIPWKGIYYLTAIYNRALDSSEIDHNFSLGYSGTSAPFIIQEPVRNQLLVGYTASFNVNVVSDSPLSYQWQKNGANISGATDSSYTTPTVTLADSGAVFRVIATNSSGSDTSDNAILQVTKANPECSQGIIHYYHLDESTSPYIDGVGFSDGTSSTPPASVTGVVGTAQNFLNQETIDIPNDVTFNWKLSDGFSIEFWMKTSATSSGTEVMVGRNDAVSSLQWWIGLDSNGKVATLLRNINNESEQHR